MAKMTMRRFEKADKAADKKAGIKEGSARDNKMDRAAVAKANMKKGKR